MFSTWSRFGSRRNCFVEVIPQSVANAGSLEAAKSGRGRSKHTEIKVRAWSRYGVKRNGDAPQTGRLLRAHYEPTTLP